MNTKINLTYDGQDYTLEYDRMSVKLLEQAGFNLEEYIAKPMNNIELAFAAAFIKHHPKVSQETMDKIYKSCPNKNQLIATLSNMIDECYRSLTDEPEGDDVGKVTWETVDSTPIETKKEKNQG